MREATINGTPKTKSGPKPKGKSEVNAKPKPEAKTPLDLTPRSPRGRMNYTSSKATGTVVQFRTGTGRSGRFKKIKPSLSRIPKPSRSLSLKPKAESKPTAKVEED
jgi:hypothetical protein